MTTINDQTRDPMVYDVMRETATLLSSGYIALERASSTDEERDRWFDLDAQLTDEVRSIDPRDQELVRAKTAEYARLRAALPAR